MIKAVIFDWGGVMCEDSDSYTAKILAKRFNKDWIELEKSLSHTEAEYSKGQGDSEEFFPRVIVVNNLDISIDELKVLFNETKTRYKMLDLVKDIKSKEIITAILSNQMKFRADFIQKNNDLSNFDHKIFSNEVGMKKPNEDIFFHTLNKINVPAENCLFLDDSETNIKVANKLGIKGILVKSTEQLLKDIKQFF
jgi:epoxide hydrolase-like predicted phosphatase